MGCVYEKVGAKPIKHQPHTLLVWGSGAMRSLVVSKEPRKDGMVLAWSRRLRGQSTVQVSATEKKKSDAVKDANKEKMQAATITRHQIKHEGRVSDWTIR